MVISCLGLRLARKIACKDTKFFGHVQGKSVIFDISPQKKPASAGLSVILIYSLFLFERQKEQASLLKHVSFLLTHLLACSFFVHQKEQPYPVMHFIRPLLFCINPDLFLSADMFVRACVGHLSLIGRWGQMMLFFDYFPMTTIATANIFDMR